MTAAFPMAGASVTESAAANADIPVAGPVEAAMMPVFLSLDGVMSRHANLAHQLLRLEATMRQQGLWGAHKPSDQALASQQPFCMDTLAIEQWLQFVFIPKMAALIAQGARLPHMQAGKGIGPMVEFSFNQRGIRCPIILGIIADIDRLLEES